MNLAQILEIPIAKLYVGKSNVRSSAGDITELTKSIEEEGVLQPILVRPVKERYEIIVGSRRFSASKAAGLKTIPAIVREMDDGEAIATSLIENIQRGNLTDEEEIEAMSRLMKLDEERYGSQRKLAKGLGLSQATIERKFTAYGLVQKLRSRGEKVTLKGSPTAEERSKGEAIPIEHAEMIERALKTEGIQKLPKRELEQKEVELVRTIAPLTQYDARKVVDRFKMFPEKSIEVIKNEALASKDGIAIRVYFTPNIGRLLTKAAEDRHMSVEELVPIAIEEWLKQVGYRGSMD
jgi:ParB family chromosome partitioning protein